MTARKALTVINGVINELPVGDAVQSPELSTGALTFAGIAITSGSQFTVGACKGVVVDTTTNPDAPTSARVNYPGATGLTTPFLLTALGTWIMLDATGTLVLQGTYPTPAERAQRILLGGVGHPSGVLTQIAPSVDYVESPMAQLRDMFTPIRLINDGVTPYAPGGTRALALLAGTLYGMGVNFVTDRATPNRLTVPAVNPMAFVYRTQLGAGGASISSIDPTSYDVGGVITAIPGAAARATNQRIYLVENGGIVIQYGQQWYPTLSDAIAAAQSEPFVLYTNLRRPAILIGILSVRKDAVALNDPAQARVLAVSKFGETVGAAGGISTATLQSAYDNSLTPKILTSPAGGAVSVRRGTAADTDSTLVVENGAGAVKFSVSGAGFTYADTLGVGSSATGVARAVIGPGTVGVGGECQLMLIPTSAATPANISTGASSGSLEIFGGTMGIAGSARGAQIDFNGGGGSAPFPGSMLFRSGVATGGTPQPVRMTLDASGTLTVTDINGTPDLILKASGVERMRIAANGNVGIDALDTSVNGLTIGSFNTTTQKLLRLFTSTSDLYLGPSSGSIFGFAIGTIPSLFQTQSVPLGIGTIAAQPIVFGTSNFERMRINAAGNVGIGVVPNTWNVTFKALQVNCAALYATTGNAAVLAANTYNDGASKYIAAGAASNYAQIGGVHSWSNAPVGVANAAATFTERMRIDEAGNVGIGIIPKPWAGTLRALDVLGAAVASSSDGLVGYFATNLYADAANWRTKATGEGSLFASSAGGFTWYSTASVAAGAPATLLERMKIDAAGNVGIRNSAPGISGLAVGGSTITGENYIRSFTSTVDLYMGQSTGTVFGCAPGTIGLLMNLGASKLGIGTLTANELLLGTNSLERMRIDAAGNVGIGVVPASTRRLDILSGAGVSPLAAIGPKGYLLVDNVGAGFNYYHAEVGHVFYAAAGQAERMRITAAGNVGIGIAAPPRPLSIASTTGNLGIYMEAAGGTPVLHLGSAGSYFGNTSTAAMVSSYAEPLLFGVSAIERMRIDTSGCVITTSTSYAGTTPSSSGSFVFSNRTVATSVPVVGGIFADTYRDVAAPHYTAGVWFNRTNVGSVTSSSDIIFGAQSSNSANSLPAERMRIDSSGNLLVGASSGSSHIIQRAVAEPAVVLQVGNGTGGSGGGGITVCGGAAVGSNAAATVLRVDRNSGTNRSISAGGTVNQSGADYAEYEDNGGQVFAKGDVVGFDADGVLTHDFATAVRFGVKSTDPGLVGGDTWGSEEALGMCHPGYEDAEALAVFEAKLEEARARVDRVAYSGKVPVNVLGALPGGYIVAEADAVGAISGVFVADVDFAQYKRAVGRVNRILEDGRAEVAVIIH